MTSRQPNSSRRLRVIHPARREPLFALAAAWRATADASDAAPGRQRPDVGPTPPVEMGADDDRPTRSGAR
jgi:hypothetical protein